MNSVNTAFSVLKTSRPLLDCIGLPPEMLAHDEKCALCNVTSEHMAWEFKSIATDYKGSIVWAAVLTVQGLEARIYCYQIFWSITAAFLELQDTDTAA